MVKYKSGRKVKVLIITILMIISGMSVFGMLPTFLGAEAEEEIGLEDNGPAEEDKSTRGGARSINYDMNMSRPGKHQDMTIWGRRARYPGEMQSPINSTAVGDVNGDGCDDLIIGAPGDNITIFEDIGLIFVIFGRTMLPSTYDLANITDLTITGLDEKDYEGFAVAVGDVNGDGLGDIISGAPGADGGTMNNREDSGEVHIFYGGGYLKNVGTWYQNETGANVTILGNNTFDKFGSAVAVGNLNSDSYDDIIVGAPGGDGWDDSIANAGEVVTIYGDSSLNTIIDLATTPPPPFTKTIYGQGLEDYSGNAVAAGDFNNDGTEDVAFCVRYGDGHMDSGDDNGEVAIVYWEIPMPSSINLAIIQANVTIYGARFNDRFGYNNLAFGDVNNDNIMDLIVGAPGVDGQTSTIMDSGATYIFYGYSNYTSPEAWDLLAKPANVTIYSNQANHESGTWVDSFDWNDDGIEDIIITVPFGNGPGEQYLYTGELYIINGSSSLTDHMTMTIQTTASGFYFFGADDNDRFGYMTTHGDLNGDTIQDIVVFADYADAEFNNKTDAGEFYVIRGETSKIPRIDSLRINNTAVPLGATFYTKLKQYEFELNITVPLGVTDLVNASIIIDPLGINLKYHWDRATDMFSEARDPNNYASIWSTSDNSTDDGDMNWTLKFNIEFNWACPRLTQAPVRVELWNALNFLTWHHYLNVFSIENRLNFTGSLLVKGENGRTLNENDWVKKSESLTWRGLTVVYEGTTDIYPNSTEYTVKLWNATASWSGTSSPGTQINITSLSGPESLGADNYIVNITQIPTANDVSNITFSLRLDAENIQFTAPMPTPGGWQTTSPVVCGITATDSGGTEVDGSNIEYSLSHDGGYNWLNWTSAGFSTDGVTVDITTPILFEDGVEHEIKWRGNDTIGNGYSESLNYSLKVDTEPIWFSNPTPVETEIFGTALVEFGIEINDNTSGVNRSSIAYSYSTDGVTWSNWISTNFSLSGSSKVVQVMANQTFDVGTGNLVRWRAGDVAGTGVVESQVQRFNISMPTQDLKVFLISPINNAELSSGSKVLRWWSNDNSSTIQFNIYLSPTYNHVRDKVSIARVAKFTTGRTFNTGNLENDTTYYWTVIPWNGTLKYGVCEDGIWNFRINPTIQEVTEPTVSVVTPANNSVIQTLNPTFSWTLTFGDKDISDVYFDVYLGTSEDTLNLFKAGISKYTIVANAANLYSYVTPTEKALENHIKYYWQVKGIGGDIIGTHWSATWNFEINISSVIKKSYDFDLLSDISSLKIKQGASKDITINIINLKNPETVELSVQSSILTMTTETIFTFSQNSVQLQENDTKFVTLTVSIPDDFEAGDYQFTVVGEMLISGDTIRKTAGIGLTVESEGKTNGGGGETADMTLAIVAVVIIIIVILILVFLLLKRKKKVEEAPPEAEERIGEEPSEEPIPMAVPEGTEGGPDAIEAGAMAIPVAAPIAQAAPTAEAEAETEAPPMEGMLSETPPPEVEAASAEVPPGEPEPTPTVPVAPATVTPAAPAEPEPAPTPTPETPEAETPSTEEAPPEATEPEMPSDLPPGAYEQPAAAPAAPPAAPAKPAETQPTEQAEAKPEEKPKDDESA
ncbi:hypothetical protein [[Eubacterium] cellulosolvens]